MAQLLTDDEVFAAPTAASPALLSDDDVFGAPAQVPAMFIRATQGAATAALTEGGDEFGAQYALVDADDVQASHDVDLRERPANREQVGTGERPRAEQERQVSAIVHQFDPARLGAADEVGEGAPGIGPDGLVEAGNARAIALQRVYQADGAKADAYRQFLRDSAPALGLSPESVDGLAKPVLVRVRTTPMDRKEVGRQPRDEDILPALAASAAELGALQGQQRLLSLQDDRLSDETLSVLNFIASNADQPDRLESILSATGSILHDSKHTGGSKSDADQSAGQEVGGEPATAADDRGPDPGAGSAGASEAVGEDWAEFPAETGSLAIPRELMPQIKAEHRGALTQFLRARGIDHQQEEVPAEALLPTQREFSLSKVRKAHEYTGGDRSILVGQDGRILDGHHQWLAKGAAGAPVKVIRFGAGIDQLLREAAAFPSSTTAEGQ